MLPLPVPSQQARAASRLPTLCPSQKHTASSKHCTFSSHCLSPRFKKCPAVKTSLEWAAKAPTKAGKIFPEFVEISSRQNLHSFAALGKQIILARVWKLAHHKNAKFEIIYQRVMTLLLWCKKTWINKAQWQLCKRLVGAIIPLSCSGLEEDITYGCGRSQQPFFCVFSHFRHGVTKHQQTTGWSKSNPAFDQWEGSLLQCESGRALEKEFYANHVGVSCRAVLSRTR